MTGWASGGGEGAREDAGGACLVVDWVGRNVGRGDLPGSGLEVEGAFGRASRFRAGGARARCHEPLGGSETSNLMTGDPLHFHIFNSPSPSFESG